MSDGLVRVVTAEDVALAVSLLTRLDEVRLMVNQRLGGTVGGESIEAPLRAIRETVLKAIGVVYVAHLAHVREEGSSSNSAREDTLSH
jgi:hypothetical protein